MKRFEMIPHTADLQIRVFGKTLEELFETALFAMFQIIEPRNNECQKKDGFLVCPKLTKKHQFQIKSDNRDLLLLDFLSEALYLSDVNNEAYFEVIFQDFSETHLEATIKGIPVEGFKEEIKGVTFHGMQIKKEMGLWTVDILFDI